MRALHALHLLWGVTRNPWNTDLSPGRVVGRVGCRARRGRDRSWPPAPTSAARSGSRPRCAALVGLQAAVRPGPGDAAVQLRHLLRGRPDGPQRRRRGAAAERARRSAPRTTRPRCGRPTCCPSGFDDVRGLRVALCDHPRRLPRRPRGRGQHPGRRRGARGGGRDRRGGRAPVDARAAERPRRGPTSGRSSGRPSARSSAEHADLLMPLHPRVRPPRRRGGRRRRRPTPRAWSRRRRSTRRWATLLERPRRAALSRPIAVLRARVAGEDYVDRGVPVAGRRGPLDRRAS